MKTKIIPFDLETAKKIQAGEIKGEIKTRDGRKARILCTDVIDDKHPIAAALMEEGREKAYFLCTLDGKFFGADGCVYKSDFDLHLEVPDDEPQNFIDSESLFDKWDYIQRSLNKLFKEKALKNNVKISDNDLVHYAAEFFTWLRETHLIFNFQWDKLEELNKYAEEHIMEPFWGDEAKYNIKKIFGINACEPQFKPFDRVLVRDSDNDAWSCALFSHKSDVGYNASAFYWNQCIPYEGNEHLVGTKNKPKEE